MHHQQQNLKQFIPQYPAGNLLLLLHRFHRNTQPLGNLLGTQPFQRQGQHLMHSRRQLIIRL